MCEVVITDTKKEQNDKQIRPQMNNDWQRKAAMKK